VKRVARIIIRTIRDFANLIDVSVVTHPAYPQTSVDARHLLVGAEVRSRVVEQMRQRMSEPSFEEQMELHQLRKRRLAILDL
jgi:phage head maturation protease